MLHSLESRARLCRWTAYSHTSETRSFASEKMRKILKIRFCFYLQVRCCTFYTRIKYLYYLQYNPYGRLSRPEVANCFIYSQPFYTADP